MIDYSKTLFGRGAALTAVHILHGTLIVIKGANQNFNPLYFI